MTLKEIIDGLKFTIDMFLFDPTTGETYTEPRNDMDKTTVDACKGAIELLEQTQWIPCSERLPEDNTLVLVTVKVGNREPKVRSGYYYMNGHFHIDNGDCWEAMDKELIAWMPLPTPYQSEIPTGAERSEE